MRAGQLRHRVRLQHFNGKEDPYGQVIKEWYDVATLWAEVRGISGKEMMTASALFSKAIIRMWIRYRPDITTLNSRFIYSMPGFYGDIYAPIAVIPDARHTLLEILCEGGTYRD
ncbi:hypothetical protein SODG_006592 [Sodalis praecaptivus]